MNEQCELNPVIALMHTLHAPLEDQEGSTACTDNLLWEQYRLLPPSKYPGLYLAAAIRQRHSKPSNLLEVGYLRFGLEAFAGPGECSRDVVAMQSEIALLLIYEKMPRMPKTVARYEAADFETSGLYRITRQPGGCFIEYDCVKVRADELTGV